MGQRKVFNCPNCAAPISADKCPYCGTVFYDFASIDSQALNYLKVKHAGRVYMVRAYLTEQQITMSPRYATVYADNMPYITRPLTPDVEISLNFVAVPDEEGVIYREVRENGR